MITARVLNGSLILKYTIGNIEKRNTVIENVEVKKNQIVRWIGQNSYEIYTYPKVEKNMTFEIRKKKKLPNIIKYLIFIVMYLLSRYFLSLFFIEYRLWINILVGVVIVLVPLFLIGKKVEEGNEKNIKVYLVISFILLLIILFVGLTCIQTEEQDENGTFRVCYGRNFLYEGSWFEYEKISFWGRRPLYV